jgi:hypothetical protein
MTMDRQASAFRGLHTRNLAAARHWRGPCHRRGNSPHALREQAARISAGGLKFFWEDASRPTLACDPTPRTDSAQG